MMMAEVPETLGTNLLKNEEPVIVGLRRAMMNNWDERYMYEIEEMGQLQREKELEFEKR